MNKVEAVNEVDAERDRATPVQETRSAAGGGEEGLFNATAMNEVGAGRGVGHNSQFGRFS